MQAEKTAHAATKERMGALEGQLRQRSKDLDEAHAQLHKLTTERNQVCVWKVIFNILISRRSNE